MVTTLIDRWPSALLAACSPVASGSTASSPAPSWAQAVVPTVGRTESVFEPAAFALTGFGRLGTVKINNSIGTPAAAPALGAAVAGATMSGLMAVAFGVLRNQQLGDDMVIKGVDARGIPPRGRRSV